MWGGGEGGGGVCWFCCYMFNCCGWEAAGWTTSPWLESAGCVATAYIVGTAGITVGSIELKFYCK